MISHISPLLSEFLIYLALIQKGNKREYALLHEKESRVFSLCSSHAGRKSIKKKERKKRASHGVQSVIATPYVLTIQATQPFVPEG